MRGSIESKVPNSHEHKIPSCFVVQPRHQNRHLDDGDRIQNEPKKATSKVQMPNAPQDSHDHTAGKRCILFLQVRQQKPAPTYFFCRATDQHRNYIQYIEQCIAFLRDKAYFIIRQYETADDDAHGRDSNGKYQPFHNSPIHTKMVPYILDDHFVL